MARLGHDDLGQTSSGLTGELGGSLSDGTGAVQQVPAVIFDADATPEIVLNADLLFQGVFERSGTDLTITHNGQQVIVEGYFSDGAIPALMSDTGATLTPQMVAGLARAGTPVDVAQLGDGTGLQQIGQVAAAEGDVRVTRADGTTAVLQEGDAVFLGDVLETSDGGNVGLLLADDTEFAVGGNSRTILDEFVYDPGAGIGEVGISVVQGAFSFVSGQAAGFGADAMQINTPVGTIGVRGTSGIGEFFTQLEIALLADALGTVGQLTVITPAGAVTLSVPGAFTSVIDTNLPPTPAVVLPSADLLSRFTQALVTVGGLQSVNVEVQSLSTQARENSGLPPVTETPSEAPDDQSILETPDNPFAIGNPFIADDPFTLGDDTSTDPFDDPISDTGGNGDEGEEAQERASGEDDSESEETVEDLVLAVEETLEDLEELFEGDLELELEDDDDDDLLPPDDGEDDEVVLDEPVIVDRSSDEENLVEFGGNAADDIATGSGNDTLYGGDGDDLLTSNEGEDVIFGDGGDDTVQSGSQNDTIFGGAGDDYLLGNSEEDVIYGGAGADEIKGGTSSDTLYGDADNDTILSGGGTNRVYGGSGDDHIYIAGVGSNDFINGGSGTDTLVLNGAIALQDISFSTTTDVTLSDGRTLQLTDITGPDAVEFIVEANGEGDILDVVNGSFGTSGGDATNGTTGADKMYGLGGNDTLSGGEGNDEVYGGVGNDTIQGGIGADTLFGGDGDDTFLRATASGSETFFGGAGSDTIRFGTGVTVTDQSVGSDSTVLTLSDGTILTLASQLDPDAVEFIVEDGGSNTIDLSALTGSIIEGDTANNVLFGSIFDDTLYGYGGNDYLDGKDGNDTLYGGEGSDTMYGGLGDNTIYIGMETTGTDVIDLSPGVDTVYLDPSLTIVHATGEGSTVKALTFSSGTALVLNSIDDNSGAEFIQVSDWDLLEVNAGPTSASEFVAVGGSSVDALDGNDLVVGNEFNNTAFGGGGNDWIVGGLGADVLDGDFGTDTLYGGDDDDTLYGSAGNDLLYGENATDTFYGGIGDDTLYGGGDDDVYYWEAGDGSDTIYTGDGSNDELIVASFDDADGWSESSGDLIFSANASEQLTFKDHYGLNSLDLITFQDLGTTYNVLTTSTGTVVGSGSNDIIFTTSSSVANGGDLSDIIAGHSGANLLLGDAGDDFLYGDGGNDSLFGGDGHDELSGGMGTDTLVGGNGNDTIVYSMTDLTDLVDGGAGDDVILLESDMSQTFTFDFSKISNVEVIDMSGATSATLNLINLEAADDELFIIDSNLSDGIDGTVDLTGFTLITADVGFADPLETGIIGTFTRYNNGAINVWVEDDVGDGQGISVTGV